MSKLECLNARVAKLLTEAVQEVLEVVKETVSEYQQKTAQTLRENENLRKKLQELQEKIPKEGTGGLKHYLGVFQFSWKCLNTFNT